VPAVGGDDAPIDLGGRVHDGEDRVALVGAAVGIVGALLLTRSMSGFLYGVRPADPLTFVGVSFALMGAALLATYLPARKAARTDPLLALRAE